MDRYSNPILCSQSEVSLSRWSCLQMLLRWLIPLTWQKKKHKMLGVYFTLADFDPFHRATLDNLQLLLLCQKLISNILTMRKCSLKWYQTLETLETWRQLDWIYMETFLRQQSFALLVIIWGRITFGDVTGNFSISPNFCQYCHITRRKLDNLERHAPVFTVRVQ